MKQYIIPSPISTSSWIALARTWRMLDLLQHWAPRLLFHHSSSIKMPSSISRRRSREAESVKLASSGKCKEIHLRGSQLVVTMKYRTRVSLEWLGQKSLDHVESIWFFCWKFDSSGGLRLVSHYVFWETKDSVTWSSLSSSYQPPSRLFILILLDPITAYYWLDH